MCRLITSSRPPLPGKPEGFSRSDTKRLPARGEQYTKDLASGQLSFLPSLDEHEEIDRVNRQALYIPSLKFDVHKGMGPQKGFLWQRLMKRKSWMHFVSVMTPKFPSILLTWVWYITLTLIM